MAWEMSHKSSLLALSINTSQKTSFTFTRHLKTILTVENTAPATSARCSKYVINPQKHTFPRRKLCHKNKTSHSLMENSAQKTELYLSVNIQKELTLTNMFKLTHTHTHRHNILVLFSLQIQLLKWRPEAKTHNTAPKSLNASISLSNTGVNLILNRKKKKKRNVLKCFFSLKIKLKPNQKPIKLNETPSK